MESSDAILPVGNSFHVPASRAITFLFFVDFVRITLVMNLLLAGSVFIGLLLAIDLLTSPTYQSSKRQ